MLKKLIAPFTTAGASGTIFRDVVVAAGAILAILGALGVLSQEQVDALRRAVNQLASPEFLAAFGILMTSGMSLYRALFRSTSDKAAEAAKRIDEEIPKDAQVVILTPAGKSDIVVQPKP